MLESSQLTRREHDTSMCDGNLKTILTRLNICNIHRDETPFPLSDAQNAILAGWRSFQDLLPSLRSRAAVDEVDGGEEDRIDLVQDLTADCSVVASLCAITARTERGHPDVANGPWCGSI